MDVLGTEIENIIFKNFILNSLNQHEILKFLSKIQKAKWLSSCERVAYPKKNNIALKG